MSDWKPENRVHGKSYTYTVYSKSGFLSRKFLVKRDDGTSYGIYDDKAAAMRKAHEKAGPGAYES